MAYEIDEGSVGSDGELGFWRAGLFEPERDGCGGDVRNDRVVQTVDFVSDDPAFAGTMTMTWAVHAVEDDARVEFIVGAVPAGIFANDHAAGMALPLENLASYLER